MRGLASNFFTSPFVRRVPSGNIATTFPSRASRTAVSIATVSCCPRWTGKAPAPSISVLRGNQYSSDFAMKRRNVLGQSGIPSGHGSKLERWLHASTKPPSGRFSRPVASSRKTP